MAIFTAGKHITIANFSVCKKTAPIPYTTSSKPGVSVRSGRMLPARAHLPIRRLTSRRRAVASCVPD